jgi:hypothetical protein
VKVIVDGRSYPMPDNYTFREGQRIKRLTGLLMGQLFPALIDGDSDAAMAVALIAVERAGELKDEEQFLDLPIGRIELDFQENGAGPLGEGEEPEPPLSGEPGK